MIKYFILVFLFYSAILTSQNDSLKIKSCFSEFVDAESDGMYNPYFNSITKSSNAFLEELYDYVYNLDSIRVTQLERTKKFCTLLYRSKLLKYKQTNLSKSDFLKVVVGNKLNGATNNNNIGITHIKTEKNKASAYLTIFENPQDCKVFFIKENNKWKLELESLLKWRVLFSGPFNEYRPCCEDEDLTTFFFYALQLDKNFDIWNQLNKN